LGETLALHGYPLNMKHRLIFGSPSMLIAVLILSKLLR
jgi:hypothetical protein